MRSEPPPDRLRNLGLTPTIQRLAVLDYLEQTTEHPTADQILTAIRKKFPSVSRATVYNALDALTKAGAVLKLYIDTSAARYDADFDPHAHFICRVCGGLHDIDVPDMQCLEEHARGHHVETMRTYAYGVCSDCWNQAEQQKADADESMFEDQDLAGKEANDA